MRTGELWRGRRMGLILDHINGVRDDNRLENLRIVCPNCAATLDTHCGRNLPRERDCAGCGKTFSPRHIRQRYCSLNCFNHTRNGASAGKGGNPSPVSTAGVPRPRTRKVERPAYERLLAEIEA